MKASHKLAACFALFVCAVTCAQDSGHLELPAIDSGDIILEYGGFGELSTEVNSSRLLLHLTNEFSNFVGL